MYFYCCTGYLSPADFDRSYVQCSHHRRIGRRSNALDRSVSRRAAAVKSLPGACAVSSVFVERLLRACASIFTILTGIILYNSPDSPFDIRWLLVLIEVARCCKAHRSGSQVSFPATAAGRADAGTVRTGRTVKVTQSCAVE